MNDWLYSSQDLNVASFFFFFLIAEAQSLNKKILSVVWMQLLLWRLSIWLH